MATQRKLFLVLLCLISIVSQHAYAQKTVEPALDESTQEKIENIAENVSEDIDVNTLLDKLNYYRERPLNLNQASRDELVDLLLLNDLQIDALLRHIAGNGKLMHLAELQTIDEFDDETIQRIRPYVMISESPLTERFNWKNIVKEGKHMVVVRVQQVMEDQAGFLDCDSLKEAQSKCYLGSKQKIYSRYRFQYGNKISVGITGEKDAGEELFKGSQKNGFDFYSAHAFYRGSGIIRNLALGDYQAQYGQGLVMWSGLAFGKSSDVMNIKRNARGLLPYSSTDENNFLRGGAIALGYKKWQLDLFYSRHPKDANIFAPDTLIQDDEVLASSFLDEGYHRTVRELEDKHTIDETLLGGNIQYKSRKLTVGFTGYQTEFSKSLKQKTYLYNQFEFSGNTNTNVGINYSYIAGNLHFFGETAQSNSGGKATVNGVLINLDPSFAVSLHQRYFEKDYQALKSNALSEQSKIANEQGFFAGLVARPVRTITINAYFDQFSFPWLRYLVDGPSHGSEYLVQLNYKPNKVFESYLRMRQQNKPENMPGDPFAIDRLQEVVQTNYRFHLRYKVSRSITLTHRVEFITLDKTAEKKEEGYMMYADVNYKAMQMPVSFSARYVLFDTESYDTRIYAYENDVLYSYSIPYNYYRGSRYYLLVQYKPVRGMDVWFRIGRTRFDNKTTVSSGLDEIKEPHKTEVKLQVRFQF